MVELGIAVSMYAYKDRLADGFDKGLENSMLSYGPDDPQRTIDFFWMQRKVKNNFFQTAIGLQLVQRVWIKCWFILFIHLIYATFFPPTIFTHKKNRQLNYRPTTIYSCNAVVVMAMMTGISYLVRCPSQNHAVFCQTAMFKMKRKSIPR